MSSSPNIYKIEKILNKRKAKGKEQYLIKWEGFPIEVSTWEPIENLECAIGLIEEYNKTHQKKLKKKNKNKKKNKYTNSNNNINTNDSTSLKSNYNNISPLLDFNNNNEMILDNEEKNEIKNEFEDIIHKVDNSFKKVINIRRSDNKLMVLVDKVKENGEVVKAYLSTEELSRTNPWILIDFYESKIKFI